MRETSLYMSCCNSCHHPGALGCERSGKCCENGQHSRRPEGTALALFLLFILVVDGSLVVDAAALVIQLLLGLFELLLCLLVLLLLFLVLCFGLVILLLLLCDSSLRIVFLFLGLLCCRFSSR